MNQLTQGLENAIKNAIEEFSSRIIANYECVDANGLETIWNSVSDNIKISVSFKETKNNNLTAITSESKENNGGCPYAFTKGAKSGETCGSNPTSGSTHCSRHKKYEGVEAKTKKTLPKAKTITEEKAQNNIISNQAKTVERVLKMNPVINKLWHKETGLVFKSANERIVYAHFTEGQTNTVPLTEEHILTCKKWQFAYEQPQIIPEKKINKSILSNSDNKPTNKPENKPENKKVDNKKLILDAINASQSQGKDVENILKQITKSNKNDDEDEDEEFEEEDEEFEEEDELEEEED